MANESEAEDCFCSVFDSKQLPVTAIQPCHPLYKEGFRRPSASFLKERSDGIAYRSPKARSRHGGGERSETEDCFCSVFDSKQSPVTAFCRATLFKKRAFGIPQGSFSLRCFQKRAFTTILWLLLKKKFGIAKD